jgi:hypothetical protein
MKLFKKTGGQTKMKSARGISKVFFVSMLFFVVMLQSHPAPTTAAEVTATENAQDGVLKTVKIGPSEEVTGYFQGDELIKRHGITTLFDGDEKYAEKEYQNGKLVHSWAFAYTGRLMSESWFRGDDEFQYQETTYAMDGSPEFEKRRLDPNSPWQIKTSTGEWIDN